MRKTLTYLKNYSTAIVSSRNGVLSAIFLGLVIVSSNFVACNSAKKSEDSITVSLTDVEKAKSSTMILSSAPTHMTNLRDEHQSILEPGPLKELRDVDLPSDDIKKYLHNSLNAISKNTKITFLSENTIVSHFEKPLFDGSKFDFKRGTVYTHVRTYSKSKKVFCSWSIVSEYGRKIVDHFVRFCGLYEDLPSGTVPEGIDIQPTRAVQQSAGFAGEIWYADGAPIDSARVPPEKLLAALENDFFFIHKDTGLSFQGVPTTIFRRSAPLIGSDQHWHITRLRGLLSSRLRFFDENFRYSLDLEVSEKIYDPKVVPEMRRAVQDSRYLGIRRVYLLGRPSEVPTIR